MRIKLTEKSINRKPPASGQIDVWDSVLPGFGMRISHGGKRVYVVMTRVHGRQIRRTLGTVEALKLSEARDAARAVMADAARGIDPEEAARKAKREAERARRHTFKAVAQDYLADTRRGGGARLKSKAELERKLDVDVYPAWADRPLASITRADVLELIRDKSKKSPVAANRVAALVARVFAWALENDLITASPAMRLRLEPETPRERALTDVEVAQVWRAAVAVGYPYGDLIRFLVLTGQRRGEVAGLVRGEIVGDSWRLPAERAKTHVGHLVPLSRQAQAILAGIEKQDSGDFLFSTTDGEKPIGGWSKYKNKIDDEILKAARKTAADAGTDPDEAKPLPAWSVHDLRRTCATGLRSLGTDRATVDKILNHSDGSVLATYDRYRADTEKRRALQAWADHVEAVVTGRPVPSNVVQIGTGTAA